MTARDGEGAAVSVFDSPTLTNRFPFYFRWVLYV